MRPIFGGLYMGFWSLRKSQDVNFGIEAGQRYRSVTTPSILWEVSAITRYPWDATPHVRLHRVGAPRDAKTISLMILRNGRFFLPAG